MNKIQALAAIVIMSFAITVITITITAQQQSAYAVVGDFFPIKTPPVDK